MDDTLAYCHFCYFFDLLAASSCCEIDSGILFFFNLGLLCLEFLIRLDGIVSEIGVKDIRRLRFFVFARFCRCDHGWE